MSFKTLAHRFAEAGELVGSVGRPVPHDLLRELANSGEQFEKIKSEVLKLSQPVAGRPLASDLGTIRDLRLFMETVSEAVEKQTAHRTTQQAARGAMERVRASTDVRDRARPAVFFYLILWAMLWAGYNTGPWYVLHPSFPADTPALIHGVRAFFPLLAGWLALTLMVTRGGVKGLAILGPLGLFGFFALIGLVPSLLFSSNVFQQTYWCLAFAAPLAILALTLSSPRPEYAVSQLLDFSWIVAMVMTAGIVLALPVIGGPTLMPTEGGAFRSAGAFTTHSLLGMAGTRSTGLGRYAGVAALAALAKLLQTQGWVKLVWIMALPPFVYILINAQGRTEIVAFIVGAFTILFLRRVSRLIMFSFGLVAAWLLANAGFFHRFWDYGTRGGRFDPTLTGRTLTWTQGWELFVTSPWVGFGGQADRYFMAGAHIHNGWLHALLESGLLGTAAFVAGFALAFAFMLRLYWLTPESRRLPLAAEVPGILVFFTLMNFTESSAYFSANWMLLAPVLAYLQLKFWQERSLRTVVVHRPEIGLQRARWESQLTAK